MGFCSQFSPRDTRQNVDPYGSISSQREPEREEDRRNNGDRDGEHDGNSIVDHQDVFDPNGNGIPRPEAEEDGDDGDVHRRRGPETHHSPDQPRECATTILVFTINM